MYRFLRSGLSRRSGPCTKSGLLLVGSLSLTLACSSEKEPNDEGGLGGTGGDSQVDSPPRNLPGDGREETPDEATSDRDVPFLPSDEFVDSVIGVQEDLDPRPRPGPDAAAPDGAGDAGVDGST